MELFGLRQPAKREIRKLVDQNREEQRELAEISAFCSQLPGKLKSGLLGIYDARFQALLSEMELTECRGDLTDQAIWELTGEGFSTMGEAVCRDPLHPEVQAFLGRLLGLFTINLDPRSPEAFEILSAILNQRELAAHHAEEEAERFQKGLLCLTPSDLKKLSSRLRWFITPSEEKKRILKCFFTVSEQQREDEGKISALYGRFRKITAENTPEKAGAVFLENPEPFYAAMRQVDAEIRQNLYRAFTRGLIGWEKEQGAPDDIPDGSSGSLAALEGLTRRHAESDGSLSELPSSLLYGTDFEKAHVILVDKPDLEEAAGRVRKARQLLREGKKLRLDDQEFNQEAVRKAVAACLAPEIGEKLDRMDLSELNRRKNGIRLSPLKNAGIRTLGELDRRGAEFLRKLDGIGEESISRIQDALEQIKREVGETARLHLNADHQTRENTDLLRKLYLYQKTETVRDDLRSLKEILAPLPALLLSGECAGFGSWSFRLLSPEMQEESIRAYRTLTDFLGSDLSEKIPEIKQALAALHPALPSEETVWADFSAHTPEYFLLLERLVPDLARKEEESGLSPELVREIEKIPIALPSLRCSLYSYQRFAVQYILHQGNVLLGDEMGLGKTIEAIGAMAVLSERGEKRHLVVCPLSVLINWKREIQDKSSLKHMILRGEGLQKALDLWLNEGGAAITSYETLQKIRIPESTRIDLLVVDEAHYVKNPSAQRTQAVARVRERSSRILYMSGTPLENRVGEMTYLISCLRPEIADEITKEEGKGFATVEKFRRMIAPVYLRRTREKVSRELPDLIDEIAWCGLEGDEERLYRASVLSHQFMSMRQISFNVSNPQKSSKGRQLLEICEDARQSGRRVLVFSFFKDTLRKVQQLLGDAFLGMIDGSVPPEERQRLIDDFGKAGPGTVLAAQINAGGTGLNIQAASVVILCEPQMKPSIENQAISRAYRTGQSRNVLVYRLMCENTVDEKIYHLLKQKQDLFEQYAGKSEAGEASISMGLQENIIKEEIRRLSEPADAHGKTAVNNVI